MASWTLGQLVSWTLELLVSWFLGLLNSWFVDLPVSLTVDLMSCSQVFRAASVTDVFRMFSGSIQLWLRLCPSEAAMASHDAQCGWGRNRQSRLTLRVRSGGPSSARLRDLSVSLPFMPSTNKCGNLGLYPKVMCTAKSEILWLEFDFLKLSEEG